MKLITIGGIAAQKKLLEYLRSNCVEIQTGYPEMNRVESFSRVFYRDALESMLKQLEERK